MCLPPALSAEVMVICRDELVEVQPAVRCVPQELDAFLKKLSKVITLPHFRLQLSCCNPRWTNFRATTLIRRLTLDLQDTSFSKS